jgi:hypothetical protein
MPEPRLHRSPIGEWGELVAGAAQQALGKDLGGELVGGQRGQEPA